MTQTYDYTIIGGGILGTSLSYFLSALTDKKVLVIEQASKVAFHTSSRNTGKVHAPFLYDPQKKQLFAKAASLGFEMWKKYAALKNLPFKQDGVLEVSLDEKGTQRLEKYLKWGTHNGLDESELRLLDASEVKKLEPHVKCHQAIFCTKDGSVNYGKFTEELKNDSQKNGTTFLFDSKVTKIIAKNDELEIKINHNTIRSKFIINASGGESIDIAHMMNVASNLTDIHFRGEYWRAKQQYQDLTKISIYSVPKHTDYPFLDPHWIVRVDGTREVGPNAVPVFSPYGYDWNENTKKFLPKLSEMLNSSARKLIFDKKFQSLASEELLSSLSKRVMINRIKEFLPDVRPSWFKERGTAGIRSSVIDENGSFVPDVQIREEKNSLHIINYNSPGATGALPFSIYLINKLIKNGHVTINKDILKISWDYEKISESMKQDLTHDL